MEVGAQVIDANVTALDATRQRILALAVQTVAKAIDVPIWIDTANHKALAAALGVCPGKPLENSITGEGASLEAVLPLVKERGCAVIGLCIDEEGIPQEAQRWSEIAKEIVVSAEAYGIRPEDVIIDPLAMTVGAHHTAGVLTLEAIRLIRMSLAVNITMGGSNISLGLPERSLINRSSLRMAIAERLKCAIVDPFDVQIRKTIAACDLLVGKDEFAMRFLAHSRTGW